VFETLNDQFVLPELYLVARLDGRSFTRLTKETHSFAAPFDERFRDLMVETTEHLMTAAGFRILYGYTESDEISLLLARGEDKFGRKVRKLVSILAGEASAKFSLLLGDVGVFDCRISQLPTAELVVDYFRWRNEDAHRNALNAHCYWLLRAQGQKARAADTQIAGLSIAAKNELLFQHGVNFNELPAWHKRGVGLVWETYEKPAVNPKTSAAVTAQRRQLSVIEELPAREAYAIWLEQLINGIEAHHGAH
jgi:tRNA(His) guanylyltransferase